MSRLREAKLPSILVSHPHAAVVANHAACAFERNGWLSGYATGVAAARGSVGERVLRWAGGKSKAALNRIVESIPHGRLKSRWTVELASRVAAGLGKRFIRGCETYDALFVAHDWAVAHTRWPRGVQAVYGYEDGARATFERARRTGVATVWDLPAAHWRTVEAIWGEERTRWSGAMGEWPGLEPEWKKRRKDAELELADAVVVASGFTRRSVEEAARGKPVLIVPYGFPVEEFAMNRTPRQGPFVVLSVGAHDLRKGTPYLLEAWRRAGLRDSRLKLIGPMRLTRGFLSTYRGLFEHVPHIPRTELEREYQAADLLVFPTLGDGFGLVIQEAMCCGTPVLTTPCGGGPECIAEGVEGWLVPPRNIEALIERLRVAATARDQLVRMGAAARRRAESYPWPAAEARLARSVATALGWKLE